MARLQTYIDDDNRKIQAEAILAELGISPKVAINMFYREIVVQRNLPFHPSDVEVEPNALTAKTIKNAKKDIDVVECKDFDDFITKLEQ